MAASQKRGAVYLHVGHLRSFRDGEPAEGTLTEALAIEVKSQSEEAILGVIFDPRGGGHVVEIDR